MKKKIEVVKEMVELFMPKQQNVNIAIFNCIVIELKTLKINKEIYIQIYEQLEKVRDTYTFLNGMIYIELMQLNKQLDNLIK